MTDALPPLPEAVEVALADLLESQFNLGVRAGRQGPRATTADKAGMQKSADAIQRAVDAIRAAIAAPTVKESLTAAPQPVAWHCPRDPDSATAFFWRRPMNGLCPNCVNPLVPVVLASAPATQQEPKP